MDRVIDVETEELNGMGYPKFRTGRKSFTTIEHTGVVIPPKRDQQSIFIATTPDVTGAQSNVPVIKALRAPATITTTL
jgi:hypothetical protein